jgi:hypothetical protein
MLYARQPDSCRFNHDDITPYRRTPLLQEIATNRRIVFRCHVPSLGEEGLMERLPTVTLIERAAETPVHLVGQMHRDNYTLPA